MNSFLAFCSRFIRPLVASVALGGLSQQVSASGPLYLCSSGQPFLWPNGGVGIPFNPDQGDLGPISHADAVALVQSAFDVWSAVPSSTVTYVNAGELPVDVDVTNFADYLFPIAPDGLSAIVFDDTGEIFDLLFGPGSGILGFASPEWGDVNCHVIEGMSFLNGPAFTDPTYAFDVMVHEFGHYSGLAHTVVNGQVYLGDSTGPTPDYSTFGLPPDPFASDVVETMYPFYFGPGIGTGSLEKDDVASISSLYPEPDFGPTTATVAGVIRSSGGVPRSGVNVIARNLGDPFGDAVSAISGDYSAFGGDPYTGVYTLRGLTPGASYAVYVDQILAGGFSTPPILLPGPEEFHNGANESNNLVTEDVPAEFTAVSAAAGATTSGVDIIFNSPRPGDPLPVGDDGSYQLALPFPVRMVGQTFDTVWVNANGNITFGGPDGSFNPSVGAFLDGLPRVAGLWRDLNPAAGGYVTFEQTATTFTVVWNKVPAFPAEGENSFRILLRKDADTADVSYGAVSALDGLAGFSGGRLVTSGTETPTNLINRPQARIRLNLLSQPANFEVFTAFPGGNAFDLGGKTVMYQHDINYEDRWAKKNDQLATATSIALPFDSLPISRYTEIEPVGADVDFYKFNASAGDVIRVEITRGGFDSVVGVFAPDGSLVALDDDSGAGLLSKVDYMAPVDGVYSVAVSAYPDLGFTGAGGSGGRYILKIDSFNLGAPGPANWLVNGSFESGDFTFWNVFESSTPFIPLTVTDGSLGTWFSPPAPQDGSFLAVGGFDGDGPMQVLLYQNATIPAGQPFLTLEWQERLQWDLFTATVPRTYAVLILDPLSFSVLKVVHLVDTGVAPGPTDSGWVNQSVDVSEFVGQSITVMFYQEIPESFSGPGQFELDNVRLRSE